MHIPLNHTLPHIPDDYINIDLFAGGGGASLGMEMAGYRVHAAVNHNPQAVAIHAINHPHTEHWVQDIYTVSPRQVTRGRPVGWLWASPDCTHHSKAKGGPPTRNARRRELAMVLVDKWLPELGDKRPLGIALENVEEFEDWGPLDRHGRVIEAEKGLMFQLFVKALRRFGYRVEWRRLRACDYGAPTIRQRLFLLARRDGGKIVWPAPTHGDPKSDAVKSGKLLPWRTAAECIDWSLPCPSVFDTAEEIKAKYGLRAQRPLADATLRRIAKGIKRYVIDAAEPFIVTCNHSGEHFRGHGVNDPMKTITAARDAHGLVMPFVQHVQHGSAPGGVMPADEPLRTVTAHPKGGGMALVAPVVAPMVTEMRTGSVGHGVEEPFRTITAGGTPARPSTGNTKALVMPVLVTNTSGHAPGSVEDPLPTLTTGSQQAVAAAHLQTYYGSHEGKQDGDLRGCAMDDPMGTVTAGGMRHSLVAAHLQRQFGESVGADCADPLPTVMPGGGGKTALCAALLKHYGGVVGQPVDQPLGTITTVDHHSVLGATIVGAGGPSFSGKPVPVDQPMGTALAENHKALATAHICKLRGENVGHGADEPLHTVSAQGTHHALVAAFMAAYYGNDAVPGQEMGSPMRTVVGHDRHGLVTVMLDGTPWVIADIGMRMLKPRELARGNGFPDWYVIERGADGKPVTQQAQVAMIGNSVPPDFARALLQANPLRYPERVEAREMPLLGACNA